MAWIAAEMSSLQAEKQSWIEAHVRAQEFRKKLPGWWNELAETLRRDVAAIERAGCFKLKVNQTREFIAVSRPMNDYFLTVTLDSGAGLIRCQYGSAYLDSNATWTVKLSKAGEIEAYATKSQRAMGCDELTEAMVKPLLRYIA